MGMTLESLRVEGKRPVVKERLKISDKGKEMSRWMSFKILTGMLLGPDDLLDDKERIYLETSSGVIGVRNIESRFEPFRKEEKCLEEGGTWDLIDSAIEEK